MLFFFVVVFFWAACTLGLTWTKFIHRYHSTSATASVACKAFKGCFFHLVSTCTASRCWIKHLFIYLFKKNINTFHNPQPTVTERGKPTEVSRGWNESCSSTRRTSGLNLRGIAIKDIFVKMLSWWRLLPLMRCLELIFPTRLSTTQTPTAPPAAVFTEHVQWERDSTVEEETDDFVRRTSFISCLILPISQSDPVCLTSNYQPTAFIHHSTTCSSSGIWKVSGGGGGENSDSDWEGGCNHTNDQEHEVTWGPRWRRSLIWVLFPSRRFDYAVGSIARCSWENRVRSIFRQSKDVVSTTDIEGSDLFRKGPE